MTHHRLGRRRRSQHALETLSALGTILGDIRRSIQLRQELDMAFHAPHLHFHIVVHPFPIHDLPLELFDAGLRFVPTCRGRLPVALPSLFLAPFGEFLLRHGGDGLWGVEVLGLVEQRGLLLGRLVLIGMGRRDLALVRDGWFSYGGGHCI